MEYQVKIEVEHSVEIEADDKAEAERLAVERIRRALGESATVVVTGIEFAEEKALSKGAEV